MAGCELLVRAHKRRPCDSRAVHTCSTGPCVFQTMPNQKTREPVQELDAQRGPCMAPLLQNMIPMKSNDMELAGSERASAELKGKRSTGADPCTHIQQYPDPGGTAWASPGAPRTQGAAIRQRSLWGARSSPLHQNGPMPSSTHAPNRNLPPH